jgi:hypothetical protein
MFKGRWWCSTKTRHRFNPWVINPWVSPVRGIANEAGTIIKPKLGSYEHHLIVTPNNIPQLFGFMMNLQAGHYRGVLRGSADLTVKLLSGETIRELSPTAGFSGVRLSCAQTLYGCHPVQPMVTGWTTGSYAEARLYSDILADSMMANGLNVWRRKIEAQIHNTDVPKEVNGMSYYESHFKVHATAGGTAAWDRLAQLCAEKPFGAHLFWNSFSRKPQPVITLRTHNGTLERHMKTLADLQDVTREANYEPSSVPESECSFWDSNPDGDQGWIYDGLARYKQLLYRVPFYFSDF